MSTPSTTVELPGGDDIESLAAHMDALPEVAGGGEVELDDEALRLALAYLWPRAVALARGQRKKGPQFEALTYTAARLKEAREGSLSPAALRMSVWAALRAWCDEPAVRNQDMLGLVMAWNAAHSRSSKALRVAIRGRGRKSVYDKADLARVLHLDKGGKPQPLDDVPLSRLGELFGYAALSD